MAYGYNPRRRSVGKPQQMAYAAAMARAAKTTAYKKFGKIKAVVKKSGYQAKGKGKFPSKTKNLFQKAQLKIPGMAGAGTFSTFTVKRPLSSWNKGLAKNGTQSTLATSSSLRTLSLVGQQGVSLPLEYNSAPNIITHIDSIKPNGTNSRTRKALIQDFQGILYMTNQSLAPLALDIYDIVPRRDIPGSGNNPTVEWANGMLDAGATVPNTDFTNVNQVAGSTPFQSPTFCQKYKIMKVTKVEIPQGCTHEHRIHFEINRSINRELLYDLLYVKGLSGMTMFVQRGFPVNNSDASQVTFSSTALDVVGTYKYNYTSISDAESSVVLNTGMATRVDRQDIINIGAGTVDANAFA